MKQTIQWHKELLVNLQAYAARKRRDSERALLDAAQAEANAQFRAMQIESAEKAGKDSFDSDLYLKSKRK